MKMLERRVEALEQDQGGFAGITRWHWIIGRVGETVEQMKARHVEDNGPIGPGEGAVCWRVR